MASVALAKTGTVPTGLLASLRLLRAGQLPWLFLTVLLFPRPG